MDETLIGAPSISNNRSANEKSVVRNSGNKQNIFAGPTGV